MNLREKQRREKRAKEDRILFIKYVIYEVVAIFILAAAGCLIKDYPFAVAFRIGVRLISFISVTILGMYVFTELAFSGWHIRRANESYAIYVAILLMIINAVLYPLADERERSYLMLLAPVLPWLIMIVWATLKRWKIL